jgi:hypothetical protein
MSDPVAAITEATATGEVAVIFADIRLVLGVDVVNLIWRHLATLPGALPWAWGVLRPLYTDGTIGGEAIGLHNSLGMPELPAFPPEVFASAGLVSSDLSSIRNVLAAYDRTNAMALVALSALLISLDDKPSSINTGLSADAKPLHPAPPTLPLPVLLNLSDLSPATAELVQTLNRLGTRRGSPILASMYRHLAHWPTYLALTWTLIAPFDSDGRLDRLIIEVVANAQLRASVCVERLHSTFSEPPEPALAATIRKAIEPFTGDVIGKMLVICAMLRAATDA